MAKETSHHEKKSADNRDIKIMRPRTLENQSTEEKLLENGHSIPVCTSIKAL